MKASEAFAAWIDGTPIEVLDKGFWWHRVIGFDVDPFQGVRVRFHDGIHNRIYAARLSDFRIAPPSGQGSASCES